MENFILEIIFLSILLSITFLYWKIKSKSTTTPPSPPKLPIIGHLHLVREMPHHDFTKLSDKYGPIMYLQLGRIPTVVISSPEIAKLVMKTHDQIFASRPVFFGSYYFTFGGRDVSFSPYGPFWRQARKICVTELLSTRRVNHFQAIRENEVNRFLNTIKSQCGAETDISKLFFTLSNDILCLAAFGKRFQENSEEEGGQTSNLLHILTESEEILSGFHLVEFFPEFSWFTNLLFGYAKKLRKNSQELADVFYELIDEHVNKKKATSSMDGEDFIDVLLRVQKKHDLELPITDDDVMALVLDIFMAGTEPTATTLEWIMTELARYPRVMKKVQEEVRGVASGSERVDESHIQQLDYLKAVIKETMRLHPATPLLLHRESMEKCMLQGYEIPAKTRIIINSYAICKDPKVWKNPTEYIPERFLDNNIDFMDQNFKFMPFGGGRRVCPGSNFGLATIELALARLLYHFDWALPPGIRADDVDLQENFAIATRKKVALLLVPTENKDYELQ